MQHRCGSSRETGGSPCPMGRTPQIWAGTVGHPTPFRNIKAALLVQRGACGVHWARPLSSNDRASHSGFTVVTKLRSSWTVRRPAREAALIPTPGTVIWGDLVEFVTHVSSKRLFGAYSHRIVRYTTFSSCAAWVHRGRPRERQWCPGGLNGTESHVRLRRRMRTRREIAPFRDCASAYRPAHVHVGTTWALCAVCACCFVELY